MENSSEFIGISDLEGVPLFLNRAGRQLVGLAEDFNVTQTTIPDFFVPEERGFIGSVVLPAIQGSGRWAGELTFQHFQTGERIPVWYDVFQIDDPETGQPINFATVTRDLREQKRAAAALKESENRIHVALEAAELGTWNVVDPQTMELKTDRRFRQIFGGRPTDEVVYEEALGVIHPEDQERVASAVARAMDPADPQPYDIEYRVIWPDESLHWVAAKGRASFESVDGATRLTSFDGTVRDVTEERRLREELRDIAARLSEAGRRKDEFLATLAHELRNPLAPIRTALDAMKLADDPASRERIRQMMIRQTEQVVHLVDDLLDASRITSGKLRLRRSRIEVASVVWGAVEAMQPSLEKAGHRLEVRLPDSPVVLDADPTRLAQILSNLLSNAIKYTRDAGDIAIEVDVRGAMVAIAVRDNGLGIAPDMQTRIFDMFGQVDQASDEARGGLGIGLTLVKSLVELHGGSITVQSKGKGMGSEFTVLLPIAPAAEVSDSDVDAPVEQKAKDLRVLVVDDNLEGAEMMTMLVELLGNEVREAHDGQEAIEVAETFLPDVVLMDIGMPRMNGNEAARHIRRQSWGKTMKLVALTGWGQEQDRAQTKEAGFDAHLVKPADIDAIKKVLARE